MDDASKILLAHVEALARELREVRDDQREIRQMLERRRVAADRKARWRDDRDSPVDSPRDNHKDSPGDSPTPIVVPKVSSPHTPLFPNPLEKNLNTSAASDFCRYVLTEWPDMKNPAAFESRAIEAFPAVDLLGEARKARGWEASSATNRKRNHGKFFWGWLGRAQDNASRNGRAVAGAVRGAVLAISDEAKREHEIPGRKRVGAP